MDKMKIAVFGGAFNPVHIGHLALIRAFDKRLNFDKILIIPSGRSPHKSSDGLIEARHRLNMCRICFDFDKRYEVSDIECARLGKSYTADTLSELKSIYCNSQLYLVCGSDMFLTLENWRSPQKIFNLAVICAAKRGDCSDEKIERQNGRLCAQGAKTVLINEPIPPVSSTKIRQALFCKEDCKELMPCGVYDYIIKNELYRK